MEGQAGAVLHETTANIQQSNAIGTWRFFIDPADNSLKVMVSDGTVLIAKTAGGVGDRVIFQV